MISGAVPTFQGAPCWLVTSKDGRYAYTANAGAGTISGFTIGNDGTLTLLTPGGATATLGAGTHPIDEAVTKDGYLYNLTDGIHRITGFSIGDDGSLANAGFDRRPAGRRRRHRRQLAAPAHRCEGTGFRPAPRASGPVPRRLALRGLTRLVAPSDG